jgi:hypothetical protein
VKILEGPKELGKPARREPPVFKAGNASKSPMENHGKPKSKDEGPAHLRFLTESPVLWAAESSIDW